MATYNSVESTSADAKQIHAGLNAVIIDYLTSTTASASDVIQLCPLPPGAEVVSTYFVARTGAPEYGIMINDTEGNIYQATATATTTIGVHGTGNGFGTRLTGSAQLQANVGNIGTALASLASADLRFIVQYLSEQEGD